MGILDTTKGLVWAFLLKIFSWLGYRGVVNTQIDIYNKMKNKNPEMLENEVLNCLISSRVEALGRVASKREEYSHYEPLLRRPDKTLEDVIWAIVEYEYILRREEHLFNRFSRMGFSATEILGEMDVLKSNARRYIKESVKEKCGCRNRQFRRLTKDYKSFLCIFFVGIVLGVLETNFIPNIPSSILVTWSIIFCLGWLFYTVKVVIDTVRVFKIIKPSGLQIGISVFLFWLFFCSPLLMGLYVVRLINRYKQTEGQN